MGAKEEEKGTDDGNEGKERKEKKDINDMQEPEIDDDHVRVFCLFNFFFFCKLLKSIDGTFQAEILLKTSTDSGVEI